MSGENTRRSLQELTIKDNFLFGAVMSDENNCRGFLEMLLGFPIGRIEVSREKSLIYHPEYKGVRLDIYANDENHTHYNIEMQMIRKKELGKRSRYYHSQVDMELLQTGALYEKLPNVYVIFICDFDPFASKKYCYTFRNQCQEFPHIFLEDGSKTIFLSTQGENPQEVSEDLVSFLSFVKADLRGSEEDFHNDYVSGLQTSIRQIKESREMGERYMIFEEMMRDERNEGRAEARRESIIELLEELGEIPESLKKSIEMQSGDEELKTLLKKAARADSVEQFQKEAEEIFALVAESE